MLCGFISIYNWFFNVDKPKRTSVRKRESRCIPNGNPHDHRTYTRQKDQNDQRADDHVQVVVRVDDIIDKHLVAWNHTRGFAAALCGIVLDTLLQEYFANVTNRVGMLYGQTPFTPPKQLSPTTLKKAINVVRHIDQYNAPLELYRNIYQGLSKCFKPDDASTLCRQNLNLLLSDTMNSLNNNKQALNAVSDRRWSGKFVE